MGASSVAAALPKDGMGFRDRWISEGELKERKLYKEG